LRKKRALAWARFRVWAGINSQAFPAMELAGLEPATSWVRFTQRLLRLALEAVLPADFGSLAEPPSSGVDPSA
jgi:hypothetical protein